MTYDPARVRASELEAASTIDEVNAITERHCREDEHARAAALNAAVRRPEAVRSVAADLAELRRSIQAVKADVLPRGMTLEVMARLVRTLQDRLDALERRTKAIEAQPKMMYGGVWKSDQHYNAGIFVTHDGSTWHCNIGNSNERPGSSKSWTLAVKRGKDMRP